MKTLEIASAVIGILDAHKGTAGEFCTWCHNYIPPEEDRKKFNDRELTMRHQGQMIADYIQELRAEEHEFIASILGLTSARDALLKRAEQIKNGES